MRAWCPSCRSCPLWRPISALTAQVKELGDENRALRAALKWTKRAVIIALLTFIPDGILTTWIHFSNQHNAAIICSAVNKNDEKQLIFWHDIFAIPPTSPSTAKQRAAEAEIIKDLNQAFTPEKC